ncbi:MAG: glycoside-pentoside-hexuronide (GPH):cation symporter [Spirochaetes bacterium]|nr:glycoside-pentoside-hexuronide (GPH):cation symporter [Spirochaetota bacterium]MBU1079975.1 glycoside-pentoside-hexuronide (GPH):cation symporter [Spirochaetota bacterium]
MTNDRPYVARPFGFRDKIGYFFGDFGNNMSFSLITGYMMLYYINVVGVSPVHFGIIILLAKVWDGINDPIVGAIVDSARAGKRGKFHSWIFWGAFPLSVAGSLLFMASPDLPYWVKIAWCAVAYFIWDSAYTVVNVPYGSLASVITADPVERSELSKYRTLGAIVAAVPLSILMPLIIFDRSRRPVGGRFAPIALGLGAVALISFMLCHGLTVERIRRSRDAAKGEGFSFFRTFGAFLRNRPMMALTLMAFAQIAFQMSTMQTNTYLFKEYFNNTRLLSIAGVASFLPMLLAVPALKPLVRRFGKKELALGGMVGSLVVSFFMFVLPIRNPLAWIGLSALSGFFASALSLLSWAMVSDAIDWQELQTGRREEGTVYAIYSLGRKIAQGIGGFVVASGLGLIGYEASLPVQPESVSRGIKLMASGFPLLGCVIIVIALGFVYTLDKGRIDDMNRRLGRAPTPRLDLPQGDD